METAADVLCSQLGLTSMSGFAAGHQCPLLLGLLKEVFHLHDLAGRR